MKRLRAGGVPLCRKHLLQSESLSINFPNVGNVGRYEELGTHKRRNRGNTGRRDMAFTETFPIKNLKLRCRSHFLNGRGEIVIDLEEV